MKYKPTIGLEIHAELKTRTKMFCDSQNNPDETEPNVNVCPVCMAHPGTLPVINKEAVKHVIRVGVALSGEVATFTEFDRKNYFYPDIPKGYQISQYAYPIIKGGELCGVKITRIHLEEDTARSSHDNGDHSLVDFNRAGVPLLELVTEPVIHTSAEAGEFARELQLLLRTIGVSEANMEKGEMRVEANISISSDGTLGTKVEIKNLNSFRSVERSVAYEIDRQSKLLDAGEEVAQETRGWDDVRGETFSQRIKETSDDYRYFPDPDLPKMYLNEVPDFDAEIIRSELPELPSERRKRYENLGIKKEDAELYVREFVLGKFFDEVTAYLDGKEEIKIASNYISSDMVGMFREIGVPSSIDINREHFAELVRMIGAGDVSSRGAKDILKIMYEKGDSPRNIAEKHSLIQVQDMDTMAEIARAVILSHGGAVSDFKTGKESTLKFLVGQGMKHAKTLSVSANPQMLEKELKKQMKDE